MLEYSAYKNHKWHARAEHEQHLFGLPVEKNGPTLYKAAETDLVPTLLEFFDVQATRIAWQ